MEILYTDKDVVVAIKSNGVLSTDEPGGMPELLRTALGTDNVRSVHRLDRVVAGLMVYALRSKAASELSRQMRDGEFHKQYLAVVTGSLPQEGELRHLLMRDPVERKTYAVSEPQKGAQEAVLRYRALDRAGDKSLVRIALLTGRTHQIRAQFSAIGCPLVGDGKYGGVENETIGLWSCRLQFRQPYSGEAMDFVRKPQGGIWDQFDYSID